jgi:hypothetical protein
MFINFVLLHVVMRSTDNIDSAVNSTVAIPLRHQILLCDVFMEAYRHPSLTFRIKIILYMAVSYYRCCWSNED